MNQTLADKMTNMVGITETDLVANPEQKPGPEEKVQLEDKPEPEKPVAENIESKDKPEGEKEPEEGPKPEGEKLPDREPKQPKRSERKFSQLLRKNAAAEAENRLLREQMDKLTSGGSRLASQPQQKNSEEKPARENYSTPEEYEAEKDAWYDLQIEKAKQYGAISAKREIENVRKVERLNEFKQTHSDYDEVMHEADEEGLQVTDLVAGALLGEDNPSLFQYYLAKNPDEVDRLNEIRQPEKLYKEIGKLSVIVSEKVNGPAPKKVVVSQAPEPQPSVKPAAVVSKDKQRQSDEEYILGYKKKKFPALYK